MKSIMDWNDQRRWGLATILTIGLTVAACGGDSEASEDGAESTRPASSGSAAPPPAASTPTASTATASPPAASTPTASTPAASTPATPAPPARAIPAGTVLRFEVRNDLSTASHQAGDRFTLRLVDGVSGTGGASLAAGAEARGVVTEARASTDPQTAAVLGLRLESLEVNGSHRTLDATVESANVQESSGSSGQRTAATIATGAAAGAVIGQILGRDTRSTVAGAAVGAIAGTGIALTTRDGHAVLPRGSVVTVRLASPLTVP